MSAIYWILRKDSAEWTYLVIINEFVESNFRPSV